MNEGAECKVEAVITVIYERFPSLPTATASCDFNSFRVPRLFAPRISLHKISQAIYYSVPNLFIFQRNVLTKIL